MSEDSIYATRRLDPENPDPQDQEPTEDVVAEGQTIITPPPLPEEVAVVPPPLPDVGTVTPPPLPDVEEVVPPPLPEPDVITITPPVRPGIAPEPMVITLDGPSEPEVVEAAEIPSPFEEAEVVGMPAVEVSPVAPPPVRPAAGAIGAQVVSPSGQPPKKNNTGLIILIVVVALFLLCCCAVVIGGAVLMFTSDTSSWDSMFLVRDFLPLL